MIAPADSPTEALLTGQDLAIRLILASEPDRKSPGTGWIDGRAGMQYLDLIPDRLDGKIIASRIRLTQGGAVADHVHYHKIDFQMIYCLAGAIRVVYEDQGPPFWLKPGDCVLQPPKVRHQVLEAEAGSEVLEIACPASHQTWIDHELQLPTASLDTERAFGGQRFVRHIAATAEWLDHYEGRVRYRDTGIGEATQGVAAVNVLSVPADAAEAVELASARNGFEFLYIIGGKLELEENGSVLGGYGPGECAVVPKHPGVVRRFYPGTEAVCLQLPGLSTSSGETVREADQPGPGDRGEYGRLFRAGLPRTQR